MSERIKVLVTDYAWSTLEPERDILSSIGADLIVAEDESETTFVKHAPNVDAILTNWARVSTHVIESAIKCQVIVRYGIGLDNIDVETATRLGITVVNVPTYCLEEVSDHAMAIILSLARKIPRLDQEVKKRGWDRNIGPQMYRLRGQKLGLIGFGKIAQLIVPKAQGFGLQVMAYSPTLTDERVKKFNVQRVDLEKLVTTSDFISLNCPLTPQTHHLINAQRLQSMKSTAYLVNTARGDIIDNNALHEALNKGWIAGAGLDVLPEEPPSPDLNLLDLDNAIITPHAAFWSEESIYDLQVTAAEEVVRVLTSQMPLSLMNPEVLQNSNLRAKIE